MAARMLVSKLVRFPPWSLATALVLAVVASFAPTLGNGFVDWDDDLNLTDNPRFRGLSWSHLRWMLATTHGGHWQPLTWLSFAIDHALWGMDPRGYHLTSLVLHAANACLVWRLLRRLLRRGTAESAAVPIDAIAAIGALLFALHPLRVESVAWATERRDVLSGFFWLAALLAYVRTVDAPLAERRRGIVLTTLALACSLTAKAWGITFPVVLLILDWYPLGRRDHTTMGALVREKIPLALVAGLAAAVAFAAQHAVPEMRSLTEHPLLARLAQAAYGLSFYLVKTAVPLWLYPARLLTTPLDPLAPLHLAAFGFVAAITLVAFHERRRRPWLLAAWSTYAVILAPVLGLAQTGPQLVADRYTYLACLPWTALATAGLAWAWRRLPEPERARRLAAPSLAVVALLGALTARQASLWHDSITLWDHTLALDPCNWIALTNRGFARSDRAAAIADYGAAITCNPRYHLAWFDRGSAYEEAGNHAAAIADYTEVIRLRPNDPDAWNNRGWARQALGDVAGAVSDYERALDLAPADWTARGMVTKNLASARARLVANPG